jgi:hypothetical protein
MSGVLGDLFGLGRPTSTATTTPTAPPDVEATRRELLGRAQAVAAEPFARYNQPRIAGFTADQLAGFQGTRDIAATSRGLSELTPGLTREGVEATRGLAQRLPDVDISEYMSPYTEAVLDPAIRDIEERAAKRRLELGQQSARTGSFGGSRQAIAESELERGTQRNIAEESAKQRAAAYTNALAQFRADQERIPQLYSGALTQLGSGLQQTAGRLGTEVNPLLATGGAEQALNQRNLDLLRESFLEERDYPLRGIEVLRTSLGLQPSTLGVGTSQVSAAPAPNVLGSVIGGIAQAPQFIQGAQALGNFFGLGGSASRAAPGLSSMFSGFGTT